MTCRDQSPYPALDLEKWERYQRRRERRHYWGQALRCNYDWNSDLSISLKRLFSRPKQHLIRLGSDNDSVHRAFEHGVPEVMMFEYRTVAGEIRLKTFRADPSLEDVTARNHTPHGSTPLSSTPEEPVVRSSPSEGMLEYKNLLEYREINRHARRKIEAWLNDGWSVEWEWNGKYCVWGKEPEHQMTLRRSDENLPAFPSPSNKRIVLESPTTPAPP